MFYSILTKAKQDSTATTTHQNIQGGNSTFTMPSSLISDPKVILEIQQIRTSEYSAKYMNIIFILSEIKKLSGITKSSYWFKGQ